MRTTEGASPTVHAGATVFTILGFAGLYFVLGVLFLGLVSQEISHGPRAPTATPAPAEPPAPVRLG